MDISAVSALGALPDGSGTLSGTQSAGNGSEVFRDVLDRLIDNVNSTDSAFQADIVKAAEGELDNPHQLVIDSDKAAVAVQLVTSVRNDALQAYNDIVKMSV